MIAREDALATMERETFDVVVVGGGITGAGVALDAASRGYSVALVERNDFAAGTSSRSSKLVHGGLRYLQNFDLGLVREALLERSLMVKLAPHLVKPLPLLVPSFGGKRPDRLMGVGLNMYDAMSWRRGRDEGEEWSPDRHRTIDGAEAVRMVPALADRDPTAAYLFYDCQTDDVRLVLTVLGEAERYGAVVARGCEAEGLVERSGRAAGVLVRDVVGGGRFELAAANVVNATGVWADQLRPDELYGEEEVPRIRPSRGTHVLLPREALDVGATGVIVPAGGGRGVFVLPWLGRTLVGTTDNDYEGDLEHVPAAGDDVAYLLKAVNDFFGSSLGAGDLVGAYAGVRPLISTGDPKKSVDISRKAELYETSSGPRDHHRRQAHHVAADGQDGRGPPGGAGGPGVGLPHARAPAGTAHRSRRASAGRGGGRAQPNPPRLPLRPRGGGRDGGGGRGPVAGRARESRPARPRGRGHLLRPPRAGADAGRRDAPPHPARPAGRAGAERARVRGRESGGARPGRGARLGRRALRGRARATGARWRVAEGLAGDAPVTPLANAVPDVAPKPIAQPGAAPEEAA